eukprot:TRINITY_DN5560_c0_g1_i1.p1 TRINITY_DN5560_c0_g1~~TRINITY_DN5560_c0_g1_i1.p1  ORF type:complete len:123 (-),score=12.66 TRINITY_DN5560_c0_g1_i1:398-766(-)
MSPVASSPVSCKDSDASSCSSSSTKRARFTEPLVQGSDSSSSSSSSTKRVHFTEPLVTTVNFEKVDAKLKKTMWCQLATNELVRCDVCGDLCFKNERRVRREAGPRSTWYHIECKTCWLTKD